MIKKLDFRKQFAKVLPMKKTIKPGLHPGVSDFKLCGL